MLGRTALALLLLIPGAASAQKLADASSAVVRIVGVRDGIPVRGSGFVVRHDGGAATVVTAAHVIEGAVDVRITFGADLTQSLPVGPVLGMKAGDPRGLAVVLVRGALPPGLTALSFDLAARPTTRTDSPRTRGTVRTAATDPGPWARRLPTPGVSRTCTAM